MNQNFVILLLTSLFSLAMGADPIQVSGTIKDCSNAPVKNAVVKLAKANICDTTDEKGNFRIYVPATATSKTIRQNMQVPFTIQNSVITLQLPSSKMVTMELFRANGQMVQSVKGVMNSGVNHITLNQHTASQLCYVRCKIDSDEYISSISTVSPNMRSISMRSGVANSSSATGSSLLVDNNPTMDMLEVRHPSFTTQKYLFNPYKDSIVAISVFSTTANWITELDSMYIDQEIFAKGLDNGNYMAMGQTHSINGDYNLCFFTLDPTGSVITKNIYGSNENDLGFEFSLQKDNSIRVFGDMWYTQDASHFDLLTMNVSPTGDSLATTVFVSKDEVMGGHGAITNDGGYIITGYRSFTDEESRTNYVPRVTRVLPSGAVAWTKEYPWPYYFSLNSAIIALSDGGFALSGYTYDDSASAYSIWLFKIDSDGTVLNKTIVKNMQRPYVRQICETTDKKLFLLGDNEKNDVEYSYLARFSSDCSLEWDTTMLDATKQIWCMTPLKDGTFLMAYNKIISKDASGLPEAEGVGIVQMKTDGTIVKEHSLIKNFGHPNSIALGKDNSILITSTLGYTFSQQKFFIINIANEFVE